MPPRLLPAFPLMNERIASNPPFSFMSDAIEATRIVTIIVSNMPPKPLPMDASADAYPREPVKIPTSTNSRIPTMSTKNTLIPAMESASTIKYGAACQMLYSKVPIGAPLETKA